MDISKSAAWILGGVSVATALTALVGIPRLAGAHPFLLKAAIVLMLLGFLFAGAAVVLNLIKAERGDGGRANRRIDRLSDFVRRHDPIPSLAALAGGFLCVLAAAGVVAWAYAMTLSAPDEPRLSLSLAPDDKTDSATVKVKFDADALNPGTFLVVDIIVVDRDTASALPAQAKAKSLVPGHRVYRAAIGSDKTGAVSSEIDTTIDRNAIGIVVAQVWPGPLTEIQGTQQGTLAANDPEADTQLCSDIIGEYSLRSCAYAVVPAAAPISTPPVPPPVCVPTPCKHETPH